MTCPGAWIASSHKQSCFRNPELAALELCGVMFIYFLPQIVLFCVFFSVFAVVLLLCLAPFFFTFVSLPGESDAV